MASQSSLDVDALRDQVKEKYREVAVEPHGEYHFHTGTDAAARCGYAVSDYNDLPPAAVESFAGVANPFSLRELQEGETVVDLGSGAGFDCFVAAQKVGGSGRVFGIDMTEEMLQKSRDTAKSLDLPQLDFKEGFIEELPFDDNSVDVVVSNGVINLCPDKRKVFDEIFRVLKPGGHLQFADIANSKPVPQAAIDNIDLWTA